MLNAIKSAIYEELITIFPADKVFYNIAPKGGKEDEGYRVIYDFITGTDSDTLMSNRMNVSIQVAIYYPSKAQQQVTSKEPDTCLKLAYEVLKLKEIDHDFEGQRVYTNTLLPDLIQPARFDNNNKEWVAIVRLRALFQHEEFELVPVTGVTISQATADVPRNRQIQLTATVEPANASNKSVTWHSSQESVAAVGTNGLVTIIGGKPDDTVDITVKTVDGEFIDTCTITILEPIPITLFHTNIESATNLHHGAKIQLILYHEPVENVLNLEWTSSNNNVATVDENGLVTIIGDGFTNITCTDSISQLSTSPLITVQVDPI